MRANYHTHTPRCRHASGTERDYVENALKGGLETLGFSDHTPYDFSPSGYRSGIRMDVEELGGYVAITVDSIVISGILGNIFAETVCNVFGIQEPVAKGIAIGCSSHALGTVKALEMGEVEGAMSSLSIALAGILTVAAASVFATLL